MASQTQFTPEIIQAFVTGTLDVETAAQVTAAAKADPELSAEIAIWRSARAVQADTVALWDGRGLSKRSMKMRINAARMTIWAGNSTAFLFGRGPLLPLGKPRLRSRWQSWVGRFWSHLFSLLEGLSKRMPMCWRARADIAAILRGVDGRIIDGPSAIGFYTIAFDDPEAMDQARQTLSESSDGVVAELTDQ